MEQADDAVRGGYAAIVDAVFAESADRDAVQHVASAAGVPFIGLWLEAPVEQLLLRIEGREGDVSDAGDEVVWQQHAHRVDAVKWHRIDASGTGQQVRDAVDAIVSCEHQGEAAG